MQQAERLAAELGVYLRMTPIGGVEADPDLRKHWQAKASHDALGDQTTCSGTDCTYLWRTVTLNSNGQVARCNYFSNIAQMGSVRDRSIVDIYNEPSNRRARAFFTARVFPKVISLAVQQLRRLPASPRRPQSRCRARRSKRSARRRRSTADPPGRLRMRSAPPTQGFTAKGRRNEVCEKCMGFNENSFAIFAPSSLRGKNGLAEKKSHDIDESIKKSGGGSTMDGFLSFH